MAIITNIDGSKKFPNHIYGIDNAIKRSAGAGYVKKDGVKHTVFELTPIPSNMVVLYTDPNDIPSGATVHTGWDNKFPMGATTSSSGSYGGSDTHDGSDHGSGGSSTGSASHSQAQDTILGGWRFQTATSHAHSANHTHPADGVSIVPEYFTCIPTSGVPVITPNAVLLSIEDFSSLGWSNFATDLIGRYLRFSIWASSTGGSATHQHDYYVGTTSTYSSNEYGTFNGDLNNYLSHNHSITHQHPPDPNEPSFAKLGFYQPPEEIAYLEDLPTGTVGIFTSTVSYLGWQQYTTLTGRLIRAGDVAEYEVTGGSDTHAMTEFTGNVGTASGSQNNIRADASLVSRRLSAHGHTFVHNHTTQANSLPQYVELYIAVKQ